MAKSVVLGMISWQTRVFVSKKEVDTKRHLEPLQAIMVLDQGVGTARPPRPCVRCVTVPIELKSNALPTTGTVVRA